MPKVSSPVAQLPPSTRAVAVDPFSNGKSDKLDFTDPALAALLEDLHTDAATFVASLPKLAAKVVVLGTARSRPVPGENGYADYVWGEKLGEALRKYGHSVGTGGGGGAMEALLRGHAAAQAMLDMRAQNSRRGQQLGWEADAQRPQREAANIVIGNEQKPNKYIDPGRLSTYRRFLFRMEFLFRNTRDFIATPGGYGTVAEVFTYLAMKNLKQVGDPVLFGSHDGFFRKLNKAFENLLGKNAPADLKNVFTDPDKLVKAMNKAGLDGMADDIPFLAARMIDALELGLTRLDGKPPAVAFVGGSGAHSEASAKVMGELAGDLVKGGATLRLGGSEVLDPVIAAAAEKAKPGSEVQSFALKTSKVAGPEVTRVDDVLVLRELLSTNLKGLVITLDDPEQVAFLFNLAVDIQTGKLPRLPIVVIDPDGKFDELKKTLGETMLTGGRHYIDDEDLDLFHVTQDPKKALEILNAPVASS